MLLTAESVSVLELNSHPETVALKPFRWFFIDLKKQIQNFKCALQGPLQSDAS